jgi:DNA-directed RNA polymerase alpha subunit
MTDDLPSGLASPARRALEGAGITRLGQLASVREDDLMQLHGMGSKALDLLRRALAAEGKTFADPERPAPDS